MAEKTTHQMRQAKATEAEWQTTLDFFGKLGEMVVEGEDQWEIGEYVISQWRSVGYSYNRILWGFDTLVKNVCDPDLDYLELKPELRDLRAERDKALKRADFAESVARRAAADAYKAIHEMHEAKRHLRQLLHALDNMTGADLSYNVRQAMREARRYLQAPAGREEE